MGHGYQKRKNVKDFFELLNSSGVRYVLIKNIHNELPDRLAIGKDIDILVDERDRIKFRFLMKNIARQYIHPCGKENGWINMYDLPEFELWRIYQKDDLLIDVTYKLCCRSLMPKVWIPLVNTIQEYIWEHRSYDTENDWWILDINTRFVYYIVRCVFDKREFNSVYKKEIQAAKTLIDRDVVSGMFDVIFFEFSPTLFQMIDHDELDGIRSAFLAYHDY